jgi:hypothetical protein
MRYLTLALIGIAFVVYFGVFGRSAVMLLPFAMTPFVVIGFLAIWPSSFWCQATLLFSAVAYSVWFVCIYVCAVILYPDPQSPIVFLFVGAWAAPVLIALWLVAFGFEWAAHTRNLD